MNSYKGNDQLLKQQSTTKAHEAQLLDARRQRKETDDQLQAMMNRIAFLAQEEVRLDRDIEAARRRAAEALARQATRDHEIAATARDVLAVMPAAAPQKLTRPHTGRSSLFSSLSDGASTATSASASAAGSPGASLRSSVAAQHSSRSLESAPSHGSASAGPVTGAVTCGSPGAPGTPAASLSPVAGLGPGSSGTPGAGAGHPPRAPSASRGRPPVATGRAADKANGKLPPVAPAPGGVTLRSPSPGGRPSSASRPGTAGRGARAASTSPTTSSSGAATSARRLSGDGPSPASIPPASPPPARAGGKGDDAVLGPGVLSAGPNHAPGMHPLGTTHHSSETTGENLALSSSSSGGGGGGGGTTPGGRNAMMLLHGTEAAAAAGELPPAALVSGGGGGGGTWAASRNAMTVIHGAADAAGELDGEVIEELTQGSRAVSGGGAGSAVGGPSGLQEFATESGRRVVLVTKTSRKAEVATVSAAGVGWGMGGRGPGAAPATIAPREARQLQAEMAKKQQIWKVRKTFGLEPTPMSDRTAQVEEVGAGVWQ